MDMVGLFQLYCYLLLNKLKSFDCCENNTMAYILDIVFNEKLMVNWFSIYDSLWCILEILMCPLNGTDFTIHE